MCFLVLSSGFAVLPAFWHWLFFPIAGFVYVSWFLFRVLLWFCVVVRSFLLIFCFLFVFFVRIVVFLFVVVLLWFVFLSWVLLFNWSFFLFLQSIVLIQFVWFIVGCCFWYDYRCFGRFGLRGLFSGFSFIVWECWWSWFFTGIIFTWIGGSSWGWGCWCQVVGIVRPVWTLLIIFCLVCFCTVAALIYSFRGSIRVCWVGWAVRAVWSGPTVRGQWVIVFSVRVVVRVEWLLRLFLGVCSHSAVIF